MRTRKSNPSSGSALPAGASEGLSGLLFGGYLVRTAAATVELQALYGDLIGIGVATVYQKISALVDAILNVADNLLTAAGADSGGAMAVNTTYAVYVSDPTVAYQPASVRASATLPVRVNGVYYLGAAGDAAKWRFCGWVRTIDNGGVPEFTNTVLQRFVINYYNKRTLKLFRCPGYLDDNLQTTYTAQKAAWGVIKANDYALEWIDNGEDGSPFRAQISWAATLVTHFVYIGIGLDSITSPKASGQDITAPLATGIDVYSYPTSTIADPHATPGTARSANYLCWTNNNVETIFADDDRKGAAADPAITYIEGWVRG